MSRFKDCLRGISIRRRMGGTGGRVRIIRGDFFIMIFNIASILIFILGMRGNGNLSNKVRSFRYRRIVFDQKGIEILR